MEFFQFFLIIDTIESLNCVIDCYSVEINKKWLILFTHKFGVHSNDSACIKVDIFG